MKRMLMFIVVCNLLLSFSLVASTEKSNVTNGAFYINDTLVESENQVIVRDKIMLLPFRTAIEAMDGKVEWNSDDEYITIEYKEKTFYCYIRRDAVYKDFILRDRLSKELDFNLFRGVCENVNGHIYLFQQTYEQLFKYLNCEVYTDLDKGEIFITKKENPNEILGDFEDVKVSDETEFKSEGIIPDAETAIAVGKIILEKYSGEPMVYETEDKIYFLVADFREDLNCWIVSRTFEFKNGGGWGGSGIKLPHVALGKATGKILYINTYDSTK